VAFGCADVWADKYRTELGVEPPTPSYLGAGYGSAGATHFANEMVADFSSTVSSAISAYEATQSSSSGSGGSGGGGGGGSW
jgi:hypothetical protein